MTQPVLITPDFQRLISGARVRLRGRSAFFATLLLHAEFVPSREVAAAGTDGERVYVNPEVAASLPPDVLDGEGPAEVGEGRRRRPREQVEHDADREHRQQRRREAARVDEAGILGLVSSASLYVALSLAY